MSDGSLDRALSVSREYEDAVQPERLPPYLTPDQRRKLTGAALAQQFEQPIDSVPADENPRWRPPSKYDGELVTRSELWPAGIYQGQDGRRSIGLAVPQLFAGELSDVGDHSPEAAMNYGRAVISNAMFPGASRALAPLPKNAIGSFGGKLGTASRESANALADRPPGIRAYHGSPHDFDKFDMSKIGTGEGAQAYGHGLYFAENEGVAKGYRDNLGKFGFNVGDAPFDDKNPLHYAAQVLQQKGSREEAIKALAPRKSMFSDKVIDDPFTANAREILQRNVDIPPYQVSPNGKLYEVNIHAHPDDFLDWDKPLSQQSEKVRNAANKAWGGGLNEEHAGRMYAPTSPEMIEKFKQLGIPGTRYLDAGSRTAGEGSRNYVVFDPSLITILRKYGGGTLYSNGGRPVSGVGLTATALADRPPGIRAYHGSPHDFDKFDMSKIGTGEGAQAYGHGLYFAENEGVAKGYRDTLTQRQGITAPRSGKTPDETAALEYFNRYAKADDTLESFERKFKHDVGQELEPRTALDAWQAMVKDGRIKEANGRMYEVNIHAHPDDFLDWDKPLSQQSEKVRGALSSLGIADSKRTNQIVRVFQTEAEAKAASNNGIVEKTLDGKGFIARNGNGYVVEHGSGDIIPNKGMHVPDSHRLSIYGIPGTRYLDAGSRSAGEGSRNYVVFDDKLISILRKYGLLGMLGGAAAAGASAGQPTMGSIMQRDWKQSVRPGDA